MSSRRPARCSARWRRTSAASARNRELAVERLVEKLREALAVQRRRVPTKPTGAQAREQRLEGKRARRRGRRRCSARCRCRLTVAKAVRLVSVDALPLRRALLHASSARADTAPRQPRAHPPEVGPDHARALGRARRPHEHPPRRGARGRLVLLVPAGADRCGSRMHGPHVRLLRRARAPRANPGAIEVACLGHCDLAPVLTRGDEIVPAVTHATNDGPALGLGPERRDARRLRGARRARGAARPAGARADRRGAEGVRPRGLRRRGLPYRAQVGGGLEGARAALRRRQRRRGRARDDQGPLRHGAPAASASSRGS